MNVLSSHIVGIPCRIRIDHYYLRPGYQKSAWLCDCDSEFYGETCIEVTVLDRKGYRAKWLDKKIDDKERRRIEKEIIEYYQEEACYTGE